jgi:hypothetical protein
VNEPNNEKIIRDSLATVRPSSDMDKLMATGNRLLREKLDEHLAATSAYERARGEMSDGYRVQMERLRMEADDKLRQLDQEHRVNIGKIEALIAKLKILREA